ncbi:MAG: hypothetical protein BGO12_09430 [Verrucomicrobia bacterium 61-8]|nr:MAG: hypothetical protein BGO12_09430 [Verrucomicrobia bacterium 61-8]
MEQTNPSNSAKQDSLKAKAIAHIQNKLITGTLAWGSQVSEEAIAQEIGISRTPVREALQVFTRLGIFQRIPRYGTIVREPDLQEIHELFEMRLALESYAVESAAKSATTESIARIEALCAELKGIGKTMRTDGRSILNGDEIVRTLAADLDFHLEIIRSLGNSMMIRYLVDTNLLLRIFTARRNKLFNLHYLAGVYGYHCRILRAIKHRDPVKAKDLVIEHIRYSETGAIELMKELTAEARRLRREAPKDEHLLLG